MKKLLAYTFLTLFISFWLFLPITVPFYEFLFTPEYITSDSHLAKVILAEKTKLGISSDVVIQTHYDLTASLPKYAATTLATKGNQEFLLTFYVKPISILIVRHEIFHVYRWHSQSDFGRQPFYFIKEEYLASFYEVTGYIP